MASHSACGHAVFSPACKFCVSLQKKWYAKLKKDPEWRDIEYGLDQPPFLYQPVDIRAIDQASTDYYDAIWSVHHAWILDGRSKRDCLIAELLAKQEGETGTERGIAAVLKSRGFKHCSRTTVQRVIVEINQIALGGLRATGAFIVEQGKSPPPYGLQTAQGRSQWPSPTDQSRVLRRPKSQSDKQPSTPIELIDSQPTSSKATG